MKGPRRDRLGTGNPERLGFGPSPFDPPDEEREDDDVRRFGKAFVEREAALKASGLTALQAWSMTTNEIRRAAKAKRGPA